MEDSPKTTSMADLEQANSTHQEELDVDLDHIGELEGYVLDARSGDASMRHLKTTKDGSTILIPQPSVDPNDPLNWSQTKKNMILAVVSFTGVFHSFLALNRSSSNIILHSLSSRLRISYWCSDTDTASRVSTASHETTYWSTDIR
jgi:hypothetical protein